MATFSTDFSEYTTGDPPSDWTAEWVTANVTWTVEEVGGALGGKVLRAVVATAGRHAMSWDGTTPPDTDVEVLVKVRSSAEGAANAGAAFHIDGTAGSEIGYQSQVSSADSFQVVEYVSGTGATRASGTFAQAVDTWYWIRATLAGTDIGAKIWADGEAEPGSQNISGSESSSRPAAPAGAFAFALGTHEFDYIGIGTDGDAAPSPAVNPTITSIVPDEGPKAGGTTITITGTGFAAGAAVTVGGAAATGENVFSSTEMTAVTPAGTVGAQDVVVTNTDTGTVTSTGGFTYTQSNGWWYWDHARRRRNA